MSNDKEYNGWTNYETWLTHLWLSNDEWIYEGTRETAKGLDHMSHECEKDDAFKEWVENEYLEDQLPESGLMADLVNAALSEVNWGEVREAFLEE